MPLHAVNFSSTAVIIDADDTTRTVLMHPDGSLVVAQVQREESMRSLLFSPPPPSRDENDLWDCDLAGNALSLAIADFDFNGAEEDSHNDDDDDESEGGNDYINDSKTLLRSSSNHSIPSPQFSRPRQHFRRMNTPKFSTMRSDSLLFETVDESSASSFLGDTFPLRRFPPALSCNPRAA